MTVQSDDRPERRRVGEICGAISTNYSFDHGVRFNRSDDCVG